MLLQRLLEDRTEHSAPRRRRPVRLGSRSVSAAGIEVLRGGACGKVQRK